MLVRSQSKLTVLDTFARKHPQRMEMYRTVIDALTDGTILDVLFVVRHHPKKNSGSATVATPHGDGKGSKFPTTRMPVRLLKHIVNSFDANELQNISSMMVNCTGLPL